MTGNTHVVLDRPAALLLAAAAQVPASDDLHRWRDDAVKHAVNLAWEAGELAVVGALAAGYDALLLQAPVVEKGRLRLRPVGNAERRHRGAFSTPPGFANALASRALQGWNADLLGERTPTVVDPSCGAGALLRAVLAHLLAAGLPGNRVLEASHGVDADPIAVLLCRA